MRRIAARERERARAGIAGVRRGSRGAGCSTRWSCTSTRTSSSCGRSTISSTGRSGQLCSRAATGVAWRARERPGPHPAEGGPAPCGACDDARRRGRARQASARAPPLSNCCAAASHVARCTLCAGRPYGLACGQAVPAGGGAGDLPAHEVQLGPPRASPRRRCLRVSALQRERAHTRMRARALARTHAWSAHTRARTHTHTHTRARARICTHLHAFVYAHMRIHLRVRARTPAARARVRPRRHMMVNMDKYPSYDGGDQGFLNSFFPGWSRRNNPRSAQHPPRAHLQRTRMAAHARMLVSPLRASERGCADTHLWDSKPSALSPHPCTLTPEPSALHAQPSGTWRCPLQV